MDQTSVPGQKRRKGVLEGQCRHSPWSRRLSAICWLFFGLENLEKVMLENKEEADVQYSYVTLYIGVWPTVDRRCRQVLLSTVFVNSGSIQLKSDPAFF
jgi:hypothetical protein